MKVFLATALGIALFFGAAGHATRRILSPRLAITGPLVWESNEAYSLVNRIDRIRDRVRRDEDEQFTRYLSQGILRLQAGEFPAAVESFNAAIQIHPESQTALQGLLSADRRVRFIDQY